jgi:predicted nuclease of predicted toxin-antitoxin system
MRLLIDMNLSPAWCDALRSHGHECVHWSRTGDVRASDAAILAWTLAHDHVLVTHDLDFGAILAASGASAPSVILLRAQDVMPTALAPALVAVLARHTEAIAEGALIVLDEVRARVRVLPLRR